MGWETPVQGKKGQVGLPMKGKSKRQRCRRNDGGGREREARVTPAFTCSPGWPHLSLPRSWQAWVSLHRCGSHQLLSPETLSALGFKARSLLPFNWANLLLNPGKASSLPLYPSQPSGCTNALHLSPFIDRSWKNSTATQAHLYLSPTHPGGPCSLAEKLSEIPMSCMGPSPVPKPTAATSWGHVGPGLPAVGVWLREKLPYPRLIPTVSCDHCYWGFVCLTLLFPASPPGSDSSSASWLPPFPVFLQTLHPNYFPLPLASPLLVTAAHCHPRPGMISPFGSLELDHRMQSSRWLKV